MPDATAAQASAPDPAAAVAAPAGAPTAAPAAVVIALGDRLRGDDAAGPLAGDALRVRGVAVIDAAGDPAGLLDAWAQAPLAIVVDAVVSGAPAGTVHRFDASATPLPASMRAGSTHALGLAEAIELGRALGRLPGRLLVYGIEAEAAGLGAAPCREVAAAAAAVADEIARVVGR